VISVESISVEKSGQVRVKYDNGYLDIRQTEVNVATTPIWYNKLMNNIFE